MKAKYIKMLNKLYEGLDQEGYQIFFVIKKPAEKLVLTIHLKEGDIEQIIKLDCIEGG